MIYAGIGSRETPPYILSLMTRMGRVMALEGHTLRSGGADGADEAFQIGCGEVDEGLVEVWLPYANFRFELNRRFPNRNVDLSNLAYTIARRTCENKSKGWWERNTSFGKDAKARNVHIILGSDCQTPVDLVTCWAPVDKGGFETGGTGHGTAVARDHNIQVINLFFDEHREAIEERVTELEKKHGIR